MLNGDIVGGITFRNCRVGHRSFAMPPAPPYAALGKGQTVQRVTMANSPTIDAPPMSTPATSIPQTDASAEKTPLRFVTAASLFDGHDAAINI
ncbi:MAG: hypothetical protein KDI75_08760, partial [Xanthomonadales bacterium]|nr:hypothetical protein [Xanthomonadales bacterium]